ncbi:MAG TPA: sugar kinase [Terriglobales bacterium]|jgi:sugar/nucleoside kinase (ribokinase family)|nr:sugar kinase [Terriglobales bacterium]
MPRFDITIAGELNLDLILYGLPDELPPERELLADRMMLTLGSSSAICAHNLAALGSKVGFQSLIGDDSLGKIALQRLAEGGVDVSRVRQVKGATGTHENGAHEKKTGLTVILQRNRWRNMVTYAGTIAELSLKDLDFDYLADSRHFHLSSLYLQHALLPDVGELFRRLKAKGLSISLDTNDDPEDLWDSGLKDLLKHVDVLLPNEREAAKITGVKDVELAVKRLAEMVPLVVVKLGSEGALAQRGKERFTSPALPVTTVDAVGAGDSFDAGFLNQYLRGADLSACLTSGNLAGALSVTRPGGTEAYRDKEYRERFLREHGA